MRKPAIKSAVSFDVNFIENDHLEEGEEPYEDYQTVVADTLEQAVSKFRADRPKSEILEVRKDTNGIIL